MSVVESEVTLNLIDEVVRIGIGQKCFLQETHVTTDQSEAETNQN